ncbi:hypothetical protein LTR56_022168 [Elasticomyces elasticus]|nr:hypothetical protein LTR56_022168 [Elasticomyces elasticus]KAK3631118.1 hypothetical protein LTR22_021236 [Elasticomyces elasticus]KAK4909489.1 hypothetical protein LTR49_021709 [Elasticomyces elasticus]KAK5748736.1 hypothetical protein LTS12_021177 [Elasticomyces elasticus]
MALASLCSTNAASVGLSSPLVGFIVDHRLRHGSTVEAHKVAEELRKLRIEPRVLTLDWDHHSSKTDHLENLARKLRYQAIGQACQEGGIDTLLVAHHADDQAETVLMRIAGKYFGTGLRGIATRRSIPECSGIYGVNNSGSPRKLEDGQVMIESGGVDIVRPLLPFTKVELVNYCKTSNVKWFEDQTNADPTFTLRNTIRHLQTNQLLPVALQSKRLLALSTDVAERETLVELAAQNEFDRLSISLDVRTGVATFDVSHERSGSTGPRVKTALLRKLLSLVTPATEIKLQDAYTTAELIWPETRSAENKQVSFQTASVNVVPPTTPINRSWTLSRQVPTQKDVALQCITLWDNAGPGLRWSTWRLWDNRYWIRICRPEVDHASPEHDSEICVRFLRKDDIAQLMKSLDQSQRSRLRRFLALAAGNTRFTIPAIVAKTNPATSESHTDEVIALPSLGWSVSGWTRWPGGDALSVATGGSFYDIRYKKVDVVQDGLHQVRASLPDVRTSRNESASRIVA